MLIRAKRWIRRGMLTWRRCCCSGGGGGFCNCNACLTPKSNLTLSVTGDVVTGPPPSPFAPDPTAPFTVTCTLTFSAGPPCIWTGTLTGIPGYNYGPCNITAGITCNPVSGIVLTIGSCSTQNNCGSGLGLSATSITCGSGFLWTGHFYDVGGGVCCNSLNGDACGGGSGLNDWTVSA